MPTFAILLQKIEFNAVTVVTCISIMKDAGLFITRTPLM